MAAVLVRMVLLLRTASPLVAPARRAARPRCSALLSTLGDYFALPAGAASGLEALGLVEAAPVQEAFWEKSELGPGAARGESACLHAPTGSGKTLAMALPAVSSVLWRGKAQPGRVLVLAPSRELVAQHAEVMGALAGAENVASVTTSSVGAPGALAALAAQIDRSAVVVATPGELCGVLEHAPQLYGSLNVEALVLDELDLLMPARKFGGKRCSRWQDKGSHPAEAVAQLVAKRSTEALQVVAGSATLDRRSKGKLDKLLRGSPLLGKGGTLPLRTVALSPERCGGYATLTVKATLPVGPKNVRTTLTSARLRHLAHSLPNKADDAAALDALLAAAAFSKPARALVFVCSSSGLKVRGVADALRRGAPGQTLVLNDALFPSSQRNRRRNYKATDAKTKKALDAREKAMDSDTRVSLTTSAATGLKAQLHAASEADPVFLVADQAVTRGLHVDDVDAVLILGKPANADTFVHLAGRADRDPLRRTDATAAAPEKRPTVLTVAKRRDVAAVRAWLADLGADLEDVDL